MLVYHTSNQYFTTPDVLHSRDALDFGKGFYVTKIREQAMSYADRYTKTGDNAYLHIFEYLPVPELKIKKFATYDEEWLDFICGCRNGGDDYKRYDIIEGGVANDKVYRTVDLYMAGIYDKNQALQKLKYEMTNNQICFITQKAIDCCLRFIEYNKI